MSEVNYDVDQEFRITEKSAPFVFQVCKAYKAWCSIYGIDPMATKFTISAGKKNLLLRFYNKTPKEI